MTDHRVRFVRGDIGPRQNNVVGNDYGALNYGAASFDATDNWWGASDGPSGGETDPSTGATADGSGDSVISAAGSSIRWDPFATSQFDI